MNPLKLQILLGAVDKITAPLKAASGQSRMTAQDLLATKKRIKELESLALKSGQTQIFIETPYRNTALLQSLLQTLQTNTRLATSSGLTLATACTPGKSSSRAGTRVACLVSSLSWTFLSCVLALSGSSAVSSSVIACASSPGWLLLSPRA